MPWDKEGVVHTHIIKTKLVRKGADKPALVGEQTEGGGAETVVKMWREERTFAKGGRE